MSGAMTESRFYMWRAVFAIAHADRVVTAEERSFLYKVLADHPFSETQIRVLEADIDHAQDPGRMFEKITDQNDRSTFFHYARALVWCDGDFGAQEQKIMIALRKSHIETIDYEALANTMQLELDEDEKFSVKRERARIADQKIPLWRKLLGRG